MSEIQSVSILVLQNYNSLIVPQVKGVKIATHDNHFS